MPKVAAVPPQILLAPTAQGENNPMEPIVQPPEPLTRTVEVQTAYRESEAQTLPYAPEYTIPAGHHPDVLLLQNLTYENGLPLDEKGMAMIEYARAKQEMETNLPPFTDEASLLLRKKLMEQQEMREFKLREAEIDHARQEKIRKVEMALAEREESNDFMTSQRLESVRLLRMEEREKALQKIRNKRIKALRRIAHQRNAADPVLSEGVKKDIIDGYFDRGSAIYAPIKRDGKDVALNPSRYDIGNRTEPLDSMNNIISLEYSIPAKYIMDQQGEDRIVPFLSKSMPVGAGHRVRGAQTIKAAEPRLTSAAQRTIRMTKRDVEEMHLILQDRKRQQQQTPSSPSSPHVSHHTSPNRSPSTSLSPTRRQGTAAGGASGGLSSALIAKKPKGRPASPDLTKDRDQSIRMQSEESVDNGGQNELLADHDFQLAVTLLQRLIRGRAVQNIMFEGKYRRRELIAELKSADMVDAVQRDASDEEILQMEKAAREERLRESSTEAVAGAVSSNLISLLADEKERVETIASLQAIAQEALKQRREREAREAGRRQKEGVIPDANLQEEP